jgi:DNA repair protein RecO (recombination protein O)
MLHTRGIVLRTVKYGETSIITDIYTRDKGLQSFIAGSVRSAKSNMPYSLFQPMQVLDLVSYFKEQSKSLHRLKEVQLALHFERIPFDVKRGAVSLFMAELLRKCISEEQEDPELYQFLEDALSYLDSGNAQVALVPLWLLTHLTDWLGIRPSLQPEPDGALVWFDLREGATTLHPNPLSEQLDVSLTLHLYQVLETPLHDLDKLVITAPERRRLLDGILKYYALHIERFHPFNAHEVLNTVFHG